MGIFADRHSDNISFLNGAWLDDCRNDNAESIRVHSCI